MSPPRLWSSCHGNLALPKLLGWEGDQIHWEETAVLDHDRGQELLVKQALHIQMTPPEEHFKWEGGLEFFGYWNTVMRSKEDQSLLTFDLQSGIQDSSIMQ